MIFKAVNMKQVFTFLFLLAGAALSAQTTATFEDFGLSSGQYLNGSGGEGGFASGNVFLPNTYDSQFMFWSGWAISSDTDTQTPGFLNQYSAITGAGYGGSVAYAVTYCSDGCLIRLEGDATGGSAEGMWVTNNAYAYYSMLDGDGFAKKFGGVSGDDPDYFLLTIKKYLNGALGPDSIDFYLADYRFANNAQDYIVDEWTYVDLSPLGDADSLYFTLTSTDVGIFGMNTPGYFCIDDFTTRDVSVATREPLRERAFEVFPNPVSDFLIVDWAGPDGADLSVVDIYGRKVHETMLRSGRNRIDVSRLPEGAFFLQVAGAESKILVKG
jgi:hypothetical protein